MTGARRLLSMVMRSLWAALKINAAQRRRFPALVLPKGRVLHRAPVFTGAGF